MSEDDRYVLKTNDGEPQGCENCGYIAPVSTFEGRPEHAPRVAEVKYELCEICASTHLAKALNFPSQVADPDLYRAVAWIGNMLRDEIKSALRWKHE